MKLLPTYRIERGGLSVPARVVVGGVLTDADPGDWGAVDAHADSSRIEARQAERSRVEGCKEVSVG
jgi:hypothetical protein